MADIDLLAEISDKTDIDNYICVQFGLKLTIDGLQELVVTLLEKTQTEIQRKCTHAPCTKNCSRKFGSSFSQWCLTCKYWKHELRSLTRNKGHWDRISWNKLDTQDIQRNFTEMAKVFIKDFHAVRQCVLQDLNALMSLFKNMNIFHFSQQIIDDVRNNRNNFIAHNYSLTLNSVEKRICLTSLIKLMETPEVKCTQTGKQAISTLQNMQSSSGLPEHLFQNRKVRQTFEIIRIELAERAPLHSIQSFNQRVNEIQNRLEKRRNYFRYLGPNPKYLKHLFFMCAAVICLLYGYYSIKKRQIEPEGCLSMSFDEHWGLSTFTDFKYHAETLDEETVIYRKWLAELVIKKIKNTTKGVLMTAHMGYGKSTIVSNIVCAEKFSGWYNLRKRVLTYHFCRYDSRISLDVALLIRNIASAIVQRFPELGNSILSDKMANEILYGSKCLDDPINCMEIGILKPLRNKWKYYDFVIIIDSLDECDIENKNNILDFLYHILDKLPTNLRFILTSRNVKKIKYRFKQLFLIKLETFLLENENDIKLYIKKESQLAEQQVQSLINIANGNFLRVKLYLKYCKDSETCDFTKIPDSLAKLYQLNFERVFKDETGIFHEIRPVFEVLCTMTNPLPEKEILDISNVTSVFKRRSYERLLGDKLGHFLRFLDGNVSLLHKSIADFLTDTSRKHQEFFIDKKNGHGLFAAYLLQSLNITRNVRFIELVHHVALSGKVDYQSKLFQLNQHVIKIDNVTLRTYLHHTVRDFNSYETTSLMLKIISKKYINAVDDHGHFALFIAAAHGNDASLLNLLDEGASPKFQVKFRFYDLLFGQELVRACKYVYFCGYNIMHISSQNGHIRIVELLLKSHKNLAYEKNDMNLNSFEVAVENGHVEIAELFLRLDKRFANERSLYYASKNGYLKIVKILLRRGIKDKCLPCNGTFYWIPPNSFRRQQEFLIQKESSSTNKHRWEWKTDYKFYDDWHLINCETSLNVAVRHNHLEIVKMLLKETFNAFNCRTYDGKTALVTAIQYNATEVFTFFLQLGYFSNEPLIYCNETHYFSYEDKLRLSKSENALLNSDRCPHGAFITHMLAITDNFEFMLKLHKSGFDSTKYDIEDSQSLTPLHYAFCRDSFNFITAGRAWNFNFKAKSKNGSTPYHSGAICMGRSLTYYTSSISANYTIPDVFDNEGRSVLQYYFLSYTEFETVKFDGALHFIFLAVTYSRHNLYHKDHIGRNFLHYAAETGNSYAFDYAYFTKTINFKRLIFQKDDRNMTPFEQLFKAMPNRYSFEAIKIPGICHFDSCNESVDIFTPHEYCIFSVAAFLRQNISALNITSLIKISLEKLRISPIISLKVVAEDEFKTVVMKSTELLELVSNTPGPILAEFILTTTTALNCEGGLSPLHRIISNKRNIHWQYANEAFLTTFLSHMSSYELDRCYDKEGYNLLHRAVMGGNVVAIRYLIKKGMNINRLSRKRGNSLNISINNAPYFRDGKLPIYYSKTQQYYMLEYTVDNQSTAINYTDSGIVHFDMTATFVLNHTLWSRRTSYGKLKHQLCAQGEERLGLVHIAAAKGLLMFLKICKSVFGVDILKCLDKNNISAKYLAGIYDQTHVIRWMKSLKLGVMLPNPDVQNLLLYNTISNYRAIREYDWICILQYSNRFQGLLYNKVKRCFTKSKVNHLSSVMSNNFYMTLTFLDTFGVVKKYENIFSLFCLIGSIDNCFNSVKVRNKIQSFVSKMRTLAELQLRIKMRFGIPDTRLLFDHLFTKKNNFTFPSIHSVFRLKYRYLSILRYDDELHHAWLTTQFHDISSNYVTSRTTNIHFETDKVLPILQNALGSHYEIIKMERQIEKEMFAFLRNITLEFEVLLKDMGSNELHKALYSECKKIINTVPVSGKSLDMLEMFSSFPDKIIYHFPSLKVNLIKFGKYVGEFSNYINSNTLNIKSPKCTKIVQTIAKWRWPR